MIKSATTKIKNLIKNIDHTLNHQNAPIIGFTYHPITIEDIGKKPLIFSGIWAIRLCPDCGDVFSGEGAKDMIGINKHAVRFNQSLIMVEKCNNGCPIDELYIKMTSIQKESECYEVGCNYCKKRVSDKLKLGESLIMWEQIN